MVFHLAFFENLSVLYLMFLARGLEMPSEMAICFIEGMVTGQCFTKRKSVEAMKLRAPKCFISSENPVMKRALSSPWKEYSKLKNDDTFPLSSSDCILSSFKAFYKSVSAGKHRQENKEYAHVSASRSNVLELFPTHKSDCSAGGNTTEVSAVVGEPSNHVSHSKLSTDSVMCPRLAALSTSSSSKALGIVKAEPSKQVRSWVPKFRSITKSFPLVRFVWSHTKANKVFLSGTFNKWATTGSMNHVGDIHVIAVFVPPGEHEYKYIVDGKWFYDICKPTTTDRHGNVNNILVLDPYKTPDKVSRR